MIILVQAAEKNLKMSREQRKILKNGKGAWTKRKIPRARGKVKKRAENIEKGRRSKLNVKKDQVAKN